MSTLARKQREPGRPKDIPDTAQMLTVARLYYVKELTKQEIGRREKIDSRKVTALLKEARAQGLVKINIFETTESTLASRLQKRYTHLLDVFIVPGPETKTAKQYSEFLKNAATAGASYFDKLVTQQKRSQPARGGQPIHVGISGGQTLLEFVNAVPPRDRENVYIHATAVIGNFWRRPISANFVHPVVTASILWNRCGSLPGHCEYATASPYVVDEPPGNEALDAIQEQLAKVGSNPAVMEVIEDMNKIDVAFCGLGVVDTSKTTNTVLKGKLGMTSLLDPIIETSDLIGRGAIGDFAYSIMDKDGAELPELPRFFLTAGHGSPHPGLGFYRQLVEKQKHVIVMAGPFKLSALKAALRGKLFNVLITDQHSAEALTKS